MCEKGGVGRAVKGVRTIMRASIPICNLLLCWVVNGGYCPHPPPPNPPTFTPNPRMQGRCAPPLCADLNRQEDRPAQRSPAQPSPAQPSTARPGPARPGPAQPKTNRP